MADWLELWWLPLAGTVVGGIILLLLEYRTGWFAQRQSSSKGKADEHKTMTKRKRISKETETELLVRSRRRCCICFGLNQNLAEKKGQIAHLDGDPSNSDPDNLAYLCFDHHDQYDSRTRQSKGLTIDEVKRYREQLYEALRAATPGPEGPSGQPKGYAPAPTEIRDTVQIGKPIIRLLRGVRISRLLQIGRPSIEVTDHKHYDEEKPPPE